MVWYNLHPAPASWIRSKGFLWGAFSCRRALEMLPRRQKLSLPARTRLLWLPKTPACPGMRGAALLLCLHATSACCSLRSVHMVGARPCSLPWNNAQTFCPCLAGEASRLLEMQNKKGCVVSGFPGEHGCAAPLGCLQGWAAALPLSARTPRKKCCSCLNPA